MLRRVRELIELALAEDIGSGDVTTAYLDLGPVDAQAFLVAKAGGVLAGLEVAFEVFRTVDPALRLIAYKKDGDLLRPGDDIAKIEGRASSILQGERTALNFLQHLSGVASITRLMADRARPARLLDTRKTAPLMRALEKYAVRVGGGYNHRFGLYDMVLLKENHIRAAGSITVAVERVRRNNTAYRIEVEVTNLDEFAEALALKVDRIMLDNMPTETMREAVTLRGNATTELEASGGVSLDSIAGIAATGVDYISSGRLTHSVEALDISLLFKE
jgi:nicotinate-nucleotide pyrophosphorylase (carboxylating)